MSTPHDSLTTNELGPLGRLYEPPHIREMQWRALHRIKQQAKLLTWTGLPSRGKTIAAMRMVELLERDYPLSQEAARYLQLAGKDAGSAAGQQLGIYNVYEELLGELPVGKQNAKRENGLATEVAEHCRLYGTRLLVLDEAGTQSAEQLRGITQIADIARRKGIPLTILLVGMDELPLKLQKKAQVRRRVAGWEMFGDWPRADLDALVFLHAPTLGVRQAEDGLAPVLDLLHSHARGCVTATVQSALDLEERLAEADGPCPLPLVLRMLASMLRAEDARRPQFAA